MGAGWATENMAAIRGRRVDYHPGAARPAPSEGLLQDLSGRWGEGRVGYNPPSLQPVFPDRREDPLPRPRHVPCRPRLRQPSDAARREEDPRDDDEVRRPPRRRLLLASREVRSRGDRPPEGGERLHRGRDEAARGLPRGALQGDARAHQGDRRERAVPAPWLVVLHAGGRGAAVPHLLPPQGLDAGARGGDARRERARQGQGLYGRRFLGGELRRELPRLRRRFHGLPRVHRLREGPANGGSPARPARAGERHRVGRGQRHALLRRSRTPPSAPTGCSATSWGRRRTRCSGRRRTSSSTWAWAPRAARPGSSRRRPRRTRRKCACCPPSSPRRPCGSSRSARPATSTTSTTTATSSGSAPTTRARTSGSCARRRRIPRRELAAGPRRTASS